MPRVIVLDSTPLGLAQSSLDADAILAAQTALAGGPGVVVTVATSNTRHLSRFPGLDARNWMTVRP